MQTQIDIFLSKIEQIAKSLGHYPKFICDSRKVEQGSVFVALKGQNTDGHNFVKAALNQGASLCIVSENFELDHEYLFKVFDVLEFIKQVSQFKLKQYKPKTIGITGSCGKTSTKYYLSKLLEEKFSVYSSFGNFNSQIGLPLALLSLEPHHEVAVIEMGMSHHGDITKLCQFAPLDYAIITSIGLAHAENFEDKDIGIARAKGEILYNHPLAFFNERTDNYQPFHNYDRKIIVDTSGIKEVPEGFSFFVNDEWIGPVKLQIDAKHLLENLHLAWALCKKLGLTDRQLINASSKLTAEKGRLCIVKKNQMTFIDDSYNASPSSMKAAISYLKKQNGARKIALIGAMRELGTISESEHLALYEDLKSDIDYIFFIGEETLDLQKKLQENSEYKQSVEELAKDLEFFLKNDDVVLIKGSHSTKLHTLLDML